MRVAAAGTSCCKPSPDFAGIRDRMPLSVPNRTVGKDMARRANRTTVESLARELSVDVDEVLLTIWDLGVQDIHDGNSTIPGKSIDKVRTALGAPSVREQMRIDYWVNALGTTRSEFLSELEDLGVRVSANARRLPKGALQRLRKKHTDPAALERTAVASSGDSQTKTHSPATPATSTVGDNMTPRLSPPFRLSQIGLPREISFLTTNDVIDIHDHLVHEFARSNDPISPPGIRSHDLLESAIERPKTGMGSRSKYPTVEMAGGALLHSIVHNHAFYNGNKRTGLVSLIAFLDRNSLLLTCSHEELFRLTLKLAKHGLVASSSRDLSDREVQELAIWIRDNSRRIDKKERPLRWHRLLRILNTYDCESDTSTGVGNRINLTRAYTKRSGILVRRRETVVLKTQAHYGGPGVEIGKDVLHYIRKELQLDEAHGVDSAVFYEAMAEPDEIIQTYRTILRKLARL